MRRSNWAYVDLEIQQYIKNIIAEDKPLSDLIKALIIDHEVFVVGGLIRDYLLKTDGIISHKDIDIVISNIDENVKIILEKYLFEMNSFGGYKVKTGKYFVDLWEIGSTWALGKSGHFGNMLLKETFPSTTFFNVTAAIFSINSGKLLFSEEFRTGIKERRVDIIYEPNPMLEMCILKTLEYYHEKKFKIGHKLFGFIKKNRNSYSKRIFDELQYDRYDKIKYDLQSIDELVNILEMKEHHKRALKANISKQNNKNEEIWES